MARTGAALAEPMARAALAVDLAAVIGWLRSGGKQ